MDELLDSSGVMDRGELRRRLARHGYLFFRGLLAAGGVLTAARTVRSHLVAGGWMAASGVTQSAPRAVSFPDALTDQAFKAAFLSPEFNRVPYLPELRTLVQQILGRKAFPYPVKVLRAVYPESLGLLTKGRYAHCDFEGIGVQDMLTSWIPLMDIPAVMGGLAVRAGSHFLPPAPNELLRAEEPGWASTDYRTGDVVLFHCMTRHAALPNASDSLRVSADFRWQRSDSPAPAELIRGPGRSEGEMLDSLLASEPWWRPVPAGVEVLPGKQISTKSPEPSRFFRVHDGWQAWAGLDREQY
jgi:hypothetical protein